MTAGYGQYDFAGRKFGAHRFAYLLCHGELEEGKVVRHLCNNRQCVNPQHLVQGTYAENYADMVARQREEQYISDLLAFQNGEYDPGWWEEIVRLGDEESDRRP